MGVEVARETDPAAWNDLVERAPHATPFHRHECLAAAAEHADAELRLLVGYKGEEPVGLFPVHVRAMGPIAAAFSPPPRLKLPYCGPVLLNFGKLKQRKAERRNRQFVERSLAWLDERHAPRYVNVRAGTRYADARPFGWDGFDVTPGYTHVVDLTRSESALLESFSRDARKNATEPGAEVSVAEGDAGTVERVVEQVRARHAEQGEPYGVPAGFPVALYRDLPDGVVRPYACRVDGRFVGGMVALEFGDTVYRWQGGATPDVDVPVNEPVDWHVMRRARERGAERYDLVGAGSRSHSQYKAKFDPDLGSYLQMTRTGPATGLLRAVYRRLR
jgi:hypothetical protein